MKEIGLIIAVIFSTLVANAQKVTVSEEIGIRSDRAYDIIGQLKENVLIYRDLGREKMVEVFDSEMKYLYNRELKLESGRANVYAIIPRDTSFTLIYGYRDDGKFYMMGRKYNERGDMIDSTTMMDGIEKFKLEKFRYKVSEDRSKTLLFSSRKNDLFYTYVIDNDEMEIEWAKESVMVGFNVRKDFRKITVSNRGEVNALFEIDNTKYNKDKHHLVLIGQDAGEGYYEHKFYFDNKLTVDLEMEYDNANRRIALAGLVSDESEYDATGYFLTSIPINQLQDEQVIEDREFGVQFLEELYGKKLSKKKRLNDFVTRDIILRGDGGILLVAEMNKEYYRRSAFNGGTRNNGFSGGGRGWLDIYNEDIIIFSMHPDGEEHWKKILYKKQFSQDDGGVYSSFFIFRTPSRLRLIYNDEIKRNNTVSEYVIDPLGNNERNSLLNTDYQKLKLRFRDAVQTSSNSLLVPSERNFKLSLVKIEY